MIEVIYIQVVPEVQKELSTEATTNAGTTHPGYAEIGRCIGEVKQGYVNDSIYEGFIQKL